MDQNKGEVNKKGEKKPTRPISSQLGQYKIYYMAKR